MAEKRLGIAELYRNLAGLLIGGEPSALGKLTGPFPIKYLVTTEGVLLQSDSHNIVNVAKREDFCSDVMKFIDVFAMHLPDYRWTAKQVKEFLDYFMMLAPRVPMPPTWTWKSDDGLAFHKLPWDPHDGPTPHWDEIMARTSNAPALQAWIGSLFVPESDRQQYVWLHGGGQNSKGTMLRFLEMIFGGSFASRVVPKGDKPFWTYGLIGKRLVAFPDTNNAGWVTSGLFKSITGDDAIEVEKKKEMPFTTRIDCKLIFASQQRPKLSSEFSDLRRVILCECAAISGPADTRYGDRLWEEGGAFLGKCIALYKTLCPDYGRIPTDTAELMELVEDNEAHFAALLEGDFHQKDRNSRNPDELLEPNRLARYIAYHFSNEVERTQFRNYLERKGHKKVNCWTKKRYQGLNLKNPALWH